MDAILLDTDAFSYLMRRGDPRADLLRPHVAGKTAAVSFITVGELYFGAEKSKWGAARLADLAARLKAVVVVPFDLDLCRVYARTRAALPPGRTVAPNDLWIAACAIRHGIPLLTNNRRHFEPIPGLQLLPSEPPSPGPQGHAPAS